MLFNKSLVATSTALLLSGGRVVVTSKPPHSPWNLLVEYWLWNELVVQAYLGRPFASKRFQKATKTSPRPEKLRQPPRPFNSPSVGFDKTFLSRPGYLFFRWPFSLRENYIVKGKRTKSSVRILCVQFFLRFKIGVLLFSLFFLSFFSRPLYIGDRLSIARFPTLPSSFVTIAFSLSGQSARFYSTWCSRWLAIICVCVCEKWQVNFFVC